MNTLDPTIHNKIDKFQRVAVFGAGISGHAARRLAQSLGLEVCLFDEGGKGDSSEFGEQCLRQFDAFVSVQGLPSRIHGVFWSKVHPTPAIVNSGLLLCIGGAIYLA